MGFFPKLSWLSMDEALRLAADEDSGISSGKHGWTEKPNFDSSACEVLSVPDLFSKNLRLDLIAMGERATISGICLSECHDELFSGGPSTPGRKRLKWQTKSGQTRSIIQHLCPINWSSAVFNQTFMSLLMMSQPMATINVFKAVILSVSHGIPSHHLCCGTFWTRENLVTPMRKLWTYGKFNPSPLRITFMRDWQFVPCVMMLAIWLLTTLAYIALYVLIVHALVWPNIARLTNRTYLAHRPGCRQWYAPIVPPWPISSLTALQL